MLLKRKLFGSFLLCSALFQLKGQSLEQIEQKRVMLPNRWGITAVGESLPLGDLPLNIALSPSKKLFAVTNNGQSDQSIQLFDAQKKTVLDSFAMGKSWLGLVFSEDEKSLYASAGNQNCIIRFDIRSKKLIPADTIVLGKPWPELISVAGLALDGNKTLYAVTKENNSLYVINLKEKNKVERFPLGGEGYTCVLSRDKKTVFVSCWGCDKIKVFNTQSKTFSEDISVGDNPNDICLSKNGAFLFIANANDNSVSVIDTKLKKVIETLNVALFPTYLSGSTTNSLAISEDGKTLYVANADNNCLAVFDVSKPGNCLGKGFIPTGWYPTCVRVCGKTLLVANGKGFSSLANPQGPSPVNRKQGVTYQQGEKLKKEKVQYIGGLFRGTLSLIPEPDDKHLAVYSKVVYKNTPFSRENERESEGEMGNPIPKKVGDKSAIKYVFYIVKENRTYDQVLSDIPGGNGDTSLLLFGEKVTPNQHKLAKEFVLLDNFYVDGEVSADGHNWSLGAYATDYLEKNWPTSYGGRGGFYNAEGTRAIANNKGGFIWDLCQRNGVSFRTYGEFADDYKPNIPVLKDHFCPYYTSWDESVRDTIRFHQWKREFDSLLLVNKVPQLNTLRFINDHTQGLKLGALSPASHVADNDYAVGLFVEHLSKSSIWKESAVFILEDDAQNGPDHVDAHRSTAYVAGGWVKRGFVDHTVYSTSSMLRTIELILGLPPMSQYDAAAIPMWRCFAQQPTATPFISVAPKVELDKRNTALNRFQKMSEEFDFRVEDRVPDKAFNDVLWFAIKGLPQAPAPVHAAFFVPREED